MSKPAVPAPSPADSGAAGSPTRPAPAHPNCATCVKFAGQFHPSHDGSAHCESGSLASGGRNAHCTCDVCF